MTFCEYIRLAFCDNGQPSSSRLLTALTTLSSVFTLIFVVVKTHGLPDGMSLTGLGAFASSPYAINRASKMFGNDKDSTTVDTKVVLKQDDKAGV